MVKHAIKVAEFVFSSNEWTDAVTCPVLHFMLMSPKGITNLKAVSSQ